MGDVVKTITPIATSIGGALLGSMLLGPGGVALGGIGGAALGGGLGGAAGAVGGQLITGQKPSLGTLALGGLGGAGVGAIRGSFASRAASPSSALINQAAQGQPLTPTQIQTLGTTALGRQLQGPSLLQTLGPAALTGGAQFLVARGSRQEREPFGGNVQAAVGNLSRSFAEAAQRRRARRLQGVIV